MACLFPFLRRPFLAGFPAVHLNRKSQSHLRKIPIDTFPILFGKISHAQREKDPLLFIDHFTGTPGQSRNTSFIQHGIVPILRYSPRQRSEFFLDLIIHAPHDLRRTGHPAAIKDRHQQLFLLRIMQAHLIKPLQEAPNLLCIHLLLLALYIQFVQHGFQPAVFRAQQMERMPGRQIRIGKILRRISLPFSSARDRFCLGAPMKQSRMNIAQLLHLLHWHSAANQQLLRICNLQRRDMVKLPHKILTNGLQRLSVRQPVNIRAQFLRAHAPFILPDHMKAMCVQFLQNLFHRNLADRRSPRQRHDVSHHLHRHRIEYFYKPQSRKNRPQLRISPYQVRHSLSQINRLHDAIYLLYSITSHTCLNDYLPHII